MAQAASDRFTETRTWQERTALLYRELWPPARAMVRRAFRAAFDDQEVEDIYSAAWVGTLQALERRHSEIDDEGIRAYLLTAVAHQASRELRRRGRRPATPLEAVGDIADADAGPDDRALSSEAARITRDVLGSLPPRRRAVMLLRYGWGLQPAEVQSLLKGLSPRAYRKEITRGVQELSSKLALVDRGEWCGQREGLLRAFASGAASEEEERAARRHLAHCRPCTEVLGGMRDGARDLWGVSGAFGLAGILDAAPTGPSGRLAELWDRCREAMFGAFPRTPEVPDAASGALASGGARGAGAAGAGLVAKLGGMGIGAKAAVACLGSGAAATACLAVGAVPGIEGLRGKLSELDPVRADGRASPAAAITQPVPTGSSRPAEARVRGTGGGDAMEGTAARSRPDSDEPGSGADTHDGEPVEAGESLATADPVTAEFSPTEPSGTSTTAGSSTARKATRSNGVAHEFGP